MRTKISKLLFYALLTLSPLLQAESVLEKGGNIFFSTANGQVRQLTHSGHDLQPALSPDLHWVVFVREIPEQPDKLNPVANNTDYANELWVITTAGKNETRLVSYGDVSGKSGAIFAIAHPQFFPDNRRIAFTAGWSVVEGSVHIVDRQTQKRQFVSAGNSVEVVPSGEYKNHLMVQRHKYFLPGGSYDWYWLLDTQGKEIGAIGDEENLRLFQEAF